jgi:molybdate transport system substrate-binding protein
MKHSALLLPIFITVLLIAHATSAIVPSARASDCTKGECITIAAAASLKTALEDIRKDYEAARPSGAITFVYGSSTKLRTQIESGAPFEMFFSADVKLVDQLVAGGQAATGAAQPFATGRIVLWLPNKRNKPKTAADLPADLKYLLEPGIQRIAIANPVLAPYGMAAQQALQAAGVWDAVKSKIVFGQDIGQAAQFVASGNAQVGIIALSLAETPQFKEKGHFFVIPSQLHQPLNHGFIITKKGAQNSLAKDFQDWILSGKAKSRLLEHGLEPTSDRTAKTEQNVSERL